MRPKIVIAYDASPAAGDGLVLGGPGYLDPMTIIGIFAAIFGISIAYEVLLLVFSDLINVRQFRAAVHLLGRRSWWPTAAHPIQPTAPGGAS